MFGLEYVIALMKILINVAFAIVSAIPSYYAWNCVAPVYLSFIPPVYQHIPYWHIVGIFLVCTFLGEQIGKLTPTFVSISQENNNKKD